MYPHYSEYTEQMIEYLEFFGNKKIIVKEDNAAHILQLLLEEKWKLKEADKDMVVMKHEIEYVLHGKTHRTDSSLTLIGRDNEHTAMALTVGLPLAICVKNFLTGQFQMSGVQIPTKKQIYQPMLNELEENGIVFREFDRQV